MKKQTITIKSNFKDIKKIKFIIQATNEEKEVELIDGKLRLTQGRIYFIPINNKEDSDNYMIKMLSDGADKWSILYTKDNLAALISLRHYNHIEHEQILCELR